jgi:hypothetical protein
MKFQSRSKVYKTGLVVFTVVCFLLFSNQSIAQSKVMDVETFDKIVVSPHIEVIFRKGKKESVSVMSITVPIEKLNIDVKKNTLNLFLDGTKIIANTKKEYVNGYKTKTSIYKGTVARVIITYKNLNSLDLRGEERFEFESYINSKKLRLQIYGESQVYFNEVAINSLLVSIYGESYLEIKQGKIENQKFTAYGESKVNTMNVESKETKLTAYGDGTFQFNVSEKLKITSYGEATIKYSGSPTLNKGIIIGETKITNIE